MRKGLAVLTVLASAACRGPQHTAPHGELAFTVQGAVEGAPLKFGAGDLKSLPRRAFAARDPHLGREVKYEGVNVAALFDDKVEAKKGADTLVFHCRDGYDVAIPLIAVKRYKPVLADEADGKPLSALNYGAPLGPLYLVWPNVDDPGLDTDPRVKPWWWAFQVEELEAVYWEKTYARALKPPPGSSDEARLGADLYGTECIQCHKLRGVGGRKGPELTDLLKTLPVDAFLATVADPKKRDPKAAMPAFGWMGKGELQKIGAFLEAVAEAGPLPQPVEEKKEPEPREPLPPILRPY